MLQSYIDMCSKAKEIQKDYKLRCGDYVSLPSPDLRVVIVITGNLGLDLNPEFVSVTFPYSYGNNTTVVRTEGLVWIPKQSQFYDMLYFFSAGTLIAAFNKWYKGHLINTTTGENDLYFFHKSMEQLWLEFTMYSRYNKKWDGKDWINDKQTENS